MIARIDVSTRRDGKVSRVEHYEAGKLVSAEEDSDGDGHVDKWERYESEHLSMVAFDTVIEERPIGASFTVRTDPRASRSIPKVPGGFSRRNPGSVAD